MPPLLVASASSFFGSCSPPCPALLCPSRTDQQVLNLNLNPVVWKAILSRKVHIADLELVDETYYRWDNVAFLVHPSAHTFPCLL